MADIEMEKLNKRNKIDNLYNKPRAFCFCKVDPMLW